MKAICLITFLVSTASAQASTNWSDVMDGIFEPAHQKGVYAGSSVVIVEGGEVVFIKGYGIADAEGNPFTDHTRSYLGSVSKSFTGLAIVMLATQGMLELDQPVEKYLPDFRAATDSSGVTIRHLLQHTSGFTRYTGNRNQTDQDLSQNGLKRTVDDLANWRLATIPGEYFDYSNANYQVLGRIIEVITGESFADAMQHMVFEPLRMNDTQIHHNFEHPNAADGFRFWGTALVSHQEPMGIGLMPQGGVSTTAVDMGRYLIGLMGGDNEIPNVWHPELAQGHNLPDIENYGAGWTVIGDGEQRLLVHHGLNAGFTAATALQPHTGKGITVIMNTGDGFLAGDVTLVHNQALQSLFPQLPAEPVDFTPRVIQLVSILSIIVGVLIWVVLARRRGLPTNYFWLRLILPTAILIFTAYAIGVALPDLFGIPLNGIGVFFPDVGLLLTLSTGLALVWAIVRAAALILMRLTDRA